MRPSVKIGSNLRPSLLLVFIMSAAAALYWPALFNGYVWDDLTLFVQSPALRTGNITWDVISQPVIQGTTYFRPLVLLSFAAEFRLFGVVPAISHAINLVIYVINVGLVFMLGRALFARMGLTRPDTRALVAASLYAIHPSLVESTVWVSGRFDQLVTTFTLCALLAELALRSGPVRSMVLAASFFFALGSKESAVSIAPLLLLQRLTYDRLENESVWRAVVRVLRGDRTAAMVLGLVFMCYMLLRLSAMDRVLHVAQVESAKTYGGHLLLVLNTIAFYLREIVVPFVQVSPLHPYNPGDLASASGLLKSTAAVAFCLVVGFSSCRNNVKGLQALSVLVALAPVLNFVPLTLAASIGNDRFLTLPLVPFMLMVASVTGMNDKVIRRPTQVLAAVMFVTCWGFIAVISVRVTTPLWKDGTSLWTWVYRKYPTLDVARTSYLVAAQAEGRFDLMKPLLDEMRAEGPLSQRQQLIYGGYLTETGHVDEGKNYILGVLNTTPRFHELDESALRKKPDQKMIFPALAYGYHALAVAQIKEGDLNGALEGARISLWYQPNSTTVMIQQSNILLALGRVAESEAIFRKALELSLPEERSVVVAKRDELLKATSIGAERAASVLSR